MLGWGGYWAWDPVENACFMPWLTATAFLHSEIVEERRGMLRVWNMTLMVATFVLTILGTFLTRSGILSSVHAFAEGTVGYWFLGFIALVLLGSMVLLAGRSTSLKSTGQPGFALRAARPHPVQQSGALRHSCSPCCSARSSRWWRRRCAANQGERGGAVLQHDDAADLRGAAAVDGRGAGAAVAQREQRAAEETAHPAHRGGAHRGGRIDGGGAAAAVRDRGLRVRRVRDRGEPARDTGAARGRGCGRWARTSSSRSRTIPGEPPALRRLSRAPGCAGAGAWRDRQQRVPHGARGDDRAGRDDHAGRLHRAHEGDVGAGGAAARGGGRRSLRGARREAGGHAGSAAQLLQDVGAADRDAGGAQPR